MSLNKLTLRFVYPPQGYYSDIRAFRVVEVEEGSDATTELYRFEHPSNGMVIGLTNFERRNLSSNDWDYIGHIEWTSPLTGAVYLGADEVNMKDLRIVKNNTSTSRRFRYKGVEYKWKVNDNGEDLYCLDSQDNLVAKWYQKRQLLRLSTRQTSLIERILVTCLLNMWFQRKDSW